MIIRSLFFCVFLLTPLVAGAATCSRANLTRCLDSACAINIGSNPAARCQYCGTSGAGTAPTSAMRSVSAGASAKYNIPDKELKKAPTDAGERYAWATTRCTQIVAGCTADDVSDIYDGLIEQSCRAAGINAQMATLRQKITKTKSSTSCQSEITACMTAGTACGSDFGNCKSDADFDKYFSSCGISVGGCDEFLTGIRTKITTDKNQIASRAKEVLASIVKSYQDMRKNKLNSIRNSCKTNELRDACVKTVCSQNMVNKCDSAHKEETTMATSLCKFYETACGTIK